MKPVLTIDNLTLSLPKGADRDNAVQNVSLSLNQNEILCIVGESGSGKSMLMSAILGLLPERIIATNGAIHFAEKDLLTLSDVHLRALRGKEIGVIFQEPMTALNPLHTIGAQIAEMFTLHTHLSKTEINNRVVNLLTDVGISNPQQAKKAYPHELSGGQRQRAMIAMALALEPKVLIADEPTTALDVTTQANILHLIKSLQAKRGTSVLFITHDFGVVAEIATRVAVMQKGELVEQGSAEQVLNRPAHSYTQRLIAAIPSLQPSETRLINKEIIISCKNLNKTYQSRGFLTRDKRITHAVKQVNLSVHKGSTLGIVGESGSGKSTLARCLVRLLAVDNGEIWFENQALNGLSKQALKSYTKQIQMVFQDPFASLNPRRKVGEQVAIGPQLYGMKKDQALDKAKQLFEMVGLDPKATDRYPHEFSGGQRQRIGLARALALEPKVLIADEPVSALDVSVQEQVLKLFTQLQEKLGLTLIFITHDLRVAAQICDHIVVMKNGEIVEQGIAASVFLKPQHAYTKSLLDAVPGRHWRAPTMTDMSPAMHI